MSITTGRSYLAIPGPTVVPDRVLRAMHTASPNIYAGAIVEMADSLREDMKRLVRTQHNVAFYIANGHGAWEASASNLFSRGDKVLLLLTGQFGVMWADAMRRHGLDVEIIDFGKATSARPEQVKDALDRDRSRKIRAVCVTHVETSTSVRTDISAIGKAMAQCDHPALLVVDAVASVGSDELRMDDWGIDVVLGASQKGIMLPPGLAFVWFSAKARAASQSADLRTPYWNWIPRADGEFYLRFGGTPPTQHLFGLRQSLDMILEEEGLEATWARHARLAEAVWRAFEMWGAGADISLNVRGANDRAWGVTTGKIGAGAATPLRRWMEDNTGVTLGFGLGMASPDQPEFNDYLRVGHMGHVNAHMTLGVLSAMEAGMIALDIPHGKGAVESAAGVLAR